MATVLTSFGCIGSATSYCCTASPPNSDTNRNLLSYEIRMSAGSEPSGSLITRWKASLPSLPTCQCHTLLPNAQLMNPPRAAGPCSQRTSSGDLSRCAGCTVRRRSEEHTSELSQSNLVCRLLLEKKKIYK